LHPLTNWEGREQEKQNLETWLDSPDVNLIGIEGVTGIGKSTLANQVFLIKEKNFINTFWIDATRRSNFNDWACDVLEAFGYQLPKHRKSDEIDESRLILTLVQCLQKEKYLLVIDNLETLLNENREWKDISYSKFFASWKIRRGSVVILTTQVIPNNLSQIKWQPLKGLKELEGAALLKKLNIQGSQEELENFSRDVEGHPMILQFAVDYLLNEYENELHIKKLSDNWLKLVKTDYRDDYIEKDLNLEKIIRESFNKLDDNSKKLLPKLSIYRDLFNIEAAVSLMPNVNITEKHLKQLAKRPFLEEIYRKDEQGNSYSLFQFQPLIKRFMKQELENSSENKEATIKKAIKYYKKVSVSKEQWQEKDDLKEHIEIFYYVCELGNYEEAKQSLKDFDDFLRSRGYNSWLCQLYECFVQKWQLIDNDQTQKSDLGDIFGKLGKSYNGLGKFDEAVNYYQKAIKLFEGINQFKKAASLQGLGKAYLKKGEYQNALANYQESKNIFCSLKKKKEQAYSLQGLGKTYHVQRKYEEAVACYKEALDILQNLIISERNQSSEAYCFDKFALTYFDMEQYEDAIKYHKKALNIYQESSINDKRSKAYSLDKLGRSYYKLEDFQQAIDYHTQALEIFRSPETKDRRGEAYSLHNLGDIHQSLKDYTEAIFYHEQSLNIFKEIGDRTGEAECYQGLGIVYQYRGEYDKAIEYHKKALTIFTNTKDRLNLAKSFDSLANSYKANNEVKLAISSYKESRKYYEEIGDTKNEFFLSEKLSNYIINDLAKSYKKSKSYPLAISFYNQAIKTLGYLTKKPEELAEKEIVVFDALGECHENLSNYQEAINYYKKARKIKSQKLKRIQHNLDNTSSEEFKKALNMLAYSVDKLGNNNRNLNRYRAAIKYYKISLKIQEQIGNYYSPGLDGRGYTCKYLAEAYEKLDKIPETIFYLEEAIKVFQKTSKKSEEAACLEKAAKLLKQTGNFQQSLARAWRAMVIRITNRNK
jgi:tetratricopeptide (TPR) repeat protein